MAERLNAVADRDGIAIAFPSDGVTRAYTTEIVNIGVKVASPPSRFTDTTKDWRYL